MVAGQKLVRITSIDPWEPTRLSQQAREEKNMCKQFQSLLLIMAMTSTLAVGQQSAARTASNLSQAGRQPLTDRDVIQMVQSGKTEADIVASIRSSRTNFDLSSQGCKLLVAAHVSRTILNAMGDGSRPPCASTAEASKPQTSSG